MLFCFASVSDDQGDSTGADRLEAIAPVGDDSGDIYVAGSTYIGNVAYRCVLT